MRGIDILARVNSLFVLFKLKTYHCRNCEINLKQHYSFFIRKVIKYFCGRKNVSLKTKLNSITMDKEQAE